MSKQHFKAIGSILTRADLLLISIILISAAVIFFTLKNSSPLKTVYIYDHGELIKTLPLTEKQQIVTIREGIEIEIWNNKVRMLNSTCPDQSCVKQGWSDNLPIVCVPNEIVLVIKSKKPQTKMLITS
jgi:hypothetical protein